MLFLLLVTDRANVRLTEVGLGSTSDASLVRRAAVTRPSLAKPLTPRPEPGQYVNRRWRVILQGAVLRDVVRSPSRSPFDVGICTRRFRYDTSSSQRSSPRCLARWRISTLCQTSSKRLPLSAITRPLNPFELSAKPGIIDAATLTDMINRVPWPRPAGMPRRSEAEPR